MNDPVDAASSQEAMMDGNIASKISEIRHQLQINVDIAKRDHPEGHVGANGERVYAIPHSQEILAGHISDRLNELEALLSRRNPASGEAELVAALRLKFETGTPAVPAGNMRCFIILMVSKHSGKDCILPAYYLNAYPLEYEECQCGDDAKAHDDGCPTTGWFYDESNFDYENCYYPIAGEVVGWAQLPSADEARVSLTKEPTHAG